jgi:hypothetical protein
LRDIGIPLEERGFPDLVPQSVLDEQARRLKWLRPIANTRPGSAMLRLLPALRCFASKAKLIWGREPTSANEWSNGSYLR